MSKKITSVTVGIAVKNVKEATKWYKSLLGDVEMMEPDPGTVELKVTDSVWIQLDGSGGEYLKLVKSGHESSIIRFQVENIKDAHELAKKLGSDVQDITTVEGVVSFFDFKDRDGNLLSFVQVLAKM